MWDIIVCWYYRFVDWSWVVPSKVSLLSAFKLAAATLSITIPTWFSEIPIANVRVVKTTKPFVVDYYIRFKSGKGFIAQVTLSTMDSYKTGSRYTPIRVDFYTTSGMSILPMVWDEYMWVVEEDNMTLIDLRSLRILMENKD